MYNKSQEQKSIDDRNHHKNMAITLKRIRDRYGSLTDDFMQQYSDNPFIERIANGENYSYSFKGFFCDNENKFLKQLG